MHIIWSKLCIETYICLLRIRLKFTIEQKSDIHIKDGQNIIEAYVYNTWNWNQTGPHIDIYQLELR